MTQLHHGLKSQLINITELWNLFLIPNYNNYIDEYI